VPELPEVETTCLGLSPHLLGRKITRIIRRRKDLRWPIPDAVELLLNQRIEALSRRAKYLLLQAESGSAIWHLGMSGNLRILSADTPIKTHDHVDFVLDNQTLLRFNDPRRFGCLMFQHPGETHVLLKDLGPEPIATASLRDQQALFFDADYLFRRSRKRSQAVKHFLMDQATVVGVGNIYVAESLFQAGVRPTRPAGKITRAECAKLVKAIQEILQFAITRGGTTLRDFLAPDGAPGYFEQELFVYGRAGLGCKNCKSILQAADLGTRQSHFCPRCQK
jgi:formamidopyrimidine-DNA glycosylase